MIDRSLANLTLVRLLGDVHEPWKSTTRGHGRVLAAREPGGCTDNQPRSNRRDAESDSVPSGRTVSDVKVQGPARAVPVEIVIGLGPEGMTTC